MMKKTLLVLSLFGLSGNALAIEGGAPLNWAEHDNLVHMKCTGTAIAGKWILTAGHCEDKLLTARVKFQDGSTQSASVNIHPEYDTIGVDIALWELPTSANTHAFTPLSMHNVEESELLTIKGFGQTVPNLNSATLKVRKQYDDYMAGRRIMMDTIGQGNSLAGDSGAPFLDTSGSIVGILRGGSAEATDGTRLHYAKDFILETVNAWHYPTLAETPANGGKVTVTVQSLHTDVIAQQSPEVISGNVAIIPNDTDTDCSKLSVEPYGTCTYTIESVDGYEGKISIGEDQVITINKGRGIPPVTPDGDSSGGSLGFLSLISLFGYGLLRRRKANAI